MVNTKMAVDVKIKTKIMMATDKKMIVNVNIIEIIAIKKIPMDTKVTMANTIIVGEKNTSTIIVGGGTVSVYSVPVLSSNTFL